MRIQHSQTTNEDETLDTFDAIGLQANRIVELLAARPCRAGGEASGTENGEDKNDGADDRGDKESGAQTEEDEDSGGEVIDSFHGEPLWNPRAQQAALAATFRAIRGTPRHTARDKRRE
jgi:hypothetical protein